uniref:Uncharacterized protein n=1 Tax=Rhizophora mucronata TaxID=61149 RepID=A0A2P2NC02_RHIMU
MALSYLGMWRGIRAQTKFAAAKAALVVWHGKYYMSMNMKNWAF